MTAHGHGRRRESGTGAALASRLPAWSLTALLLGVVLRLVAITGAPLHGDRGTVPAFNDEPSHLNHVLALAATGRAPVQRLAVHDEHALERGEVEYYQPPLYYFAAAAWRELLPNGWRSPAAMRLLSLAFWLAALYIVLRWAPSTELRAPLLLAGALLGAGFIPSTTINNDALFALAAAVLYALATRAGWGYLGLLGLLNLGLASAVAFWCKPAALTLLPMVFAAAWVGGPDGDGRNLKRVFVTGLVFLWTVLPLAMMRHALYGSPLSIEAAASGGAPLPMRERIVAAVYSLVSPWMGLWSSFWVKIPALLFALACLVFLVWGVARQRELRAFLRDRGAEKAALLWMIGAAFSVLGWLFYALRYSQAEARLLLAAAPGLTLLAGWPLWRWSGWRRTTLGWGIMALLALPFIAWGMH